MTSDQYHRDLTDPNVRRPGRVDLELFQDIEACFDGNPGLQRALKNWAKHYLHDTIMEYALDLNNKGIKNIGTLEDDIDFGGYDIDNLDNIDERVYFVSTDAELDNAITDITTNQCAGRIIITDSLTNVQATINGANSSFVIESNGEEVELDANGDNIVISITNCLSCIIRDIKIDASDLTTASTAVININEASDHNVIIDNVHITGDGSNGYGIDINSDNVMVKNCEIDNVDQAINMYNADNCSILNNYIHDNDSIAIYMGGCDYCIIDGNMFYNNCLSESQKAEIHMPQLNTACTHCIISNNTMKDVIWGGVFMYATGNNDYNVISNNIIDGAGTASGLATAGIWLVDGTGITVNGNVVNGFTNGGAGTGYGIFINNAGCVNATIVGNTFLGNDTNLDVAGGNNPFYQAGGDDLNNIA